MKNTELEIWCGTDQWLHHESMAIITSSCFSCFPVRRTMRKDCVHAGVSLSESLIVSIEAKTTSSTASGKSRELSKNPACGGHQDHSPGDSKRQYHSFWQVQRALKTAGLSRLHLRPHPDPQQLQQVERSRISPLHQRRCQAGIGLAQSPLPEPFPKTQSPYSCNTCLQAASKQC
jgi:hypothetical protein